MPRQSQRRRICRLARRFLLAKARVAAMEDDAYDDVLTPADREAVCGEMFAARAQLVATVLAAAGRDLDSTPVVVDVGACLVVVAEAPENEGVPEQVYDPAVAVFDKDRIIKLGHGVARA